MTIGNVKQKIITQFPYHGTTPTSISGKLTDYGLFHIVSTPFQGNFPPLYPLSREHYGEPYSLSFILFYLVWGNTGTYFTIILGGGGG